MEEKTKKCPYCGEEILAVAKKCKHCGEWLNNDEEQKEEKLMIPCPICGEMIEDGTTKCPHCNELLKSEVVLEAIKEDQNTKDDDKSRSFFDYYFIEPFIKHYFKFKGRVNRKHFWISILLWFVFSALIISVFIFNLSHGASKTVGNTMGVIMAVWFFGSTIPLGAIVLRRMRDGDSEIGLWGWWFYILPLPYMIFIAVSKLPSWLCIIPFVILLWWLIKPSDDNMRDDGLLPDKQPEIKFKKSDKVFLLIIVLVSSIICLAGSFSNADEVPTEGISSSRDVEIGKQTRDAVLQDNIKKLYIAQLAKREALDEDAGFSSTYFLHDITNDSIPELWIRSGNGVNNYILSIYTYDNGLKELCNDEEGNEGIFTYYEGKNYILQVAKGKGNGYSGWFKISFKEGALSSEYIYGENLNESGKSDFSEPTEKPIVSFPIDNLLPITSMFEK